MKKIQHLGDTAYKAEYKGVIYIVYKISKLWYVDFTGVNTTEREAAYNYPTKKQAIEFAVYLIDKAKK